MKILLRVLLGLAMTLLAIATIIGALQTANADAPNTDPATNTSISHP